MKVPQSGLIVLMQYLNQKRLNRVYFASYIPIFMDTMRSFIMLTNNLKRENSTKTGNLEI